MAKANHLLSTRELQVLKIIIEGATAEEIASKLNITKETVNFHRKSIKAKLGAGNVASMVALAFRKGLVK